MLTQKNNSKFEYGDRFLLMFISCKTKKSFKSSARNGTLNSTIGIIKAKVKRVIISNDGPFLFILLFASSCAPPEPFYYSIFINKSNSTLSQNSQRFSKFSMVKKKGKKKQIIVFMTYDSLREKTFSSKEAKNYSCILYLKEIEGRRWGRKRRRKVIFAIEGTFPVGIISFKLSSNTVDNFGYHYYRHYIYIKKKRRIANFSHCSLENPCPPFHFVLILFFLIFSPILRLLYTSSLTASTLYLSAFFLPWRKLLYWDEEEKGRFEQLTFRG